MLLVLLCLGLAAGEQWPPMMQKLSLERDLSKFAHQLMNNKLARSALKYRELTIFAPTNEAFDRYQGEISDDLVLYHMVPMARTLENMQEMSLDPLMEEHPPLWINLDGSAVYVNNAKVIRSLPEVVKSRGDQYGKSQVLYIIDEVLTPMAQTTSSPSAYDFITQPNLWKTVPYTFHIFYRKLVQTRSQYGYKGEKKGTFFVPVDQFMDRNVAGQIDREIIDTHSIPNRAVFTRSAFDDFAYVTRGTDKDFYTTIEFLGDDAVKVSKIDKRSSRKIGEKQISILRANIPIQNGVVHVVREPIGVFERRLTKFPYLPVLDKIQSDPNLNITDHLFRTSGLSKLIDNDALNFTIFAPVDSAWRKVAGLHKFNMSEFDSQLFRERAAKITRRHVVAGAVYSLQHLLEISANLRGKEVVLDVGSEKILLKITARDGRHFIKWGHSDIEIIKADYECSNGVIHLVNVPLLFDSEVKGLGPDAKYTSLLYKTWNVVKTILV